MHPVEFLTLGASYRTGKKPPLAEDVEKDDEIKRLGLDATFKYKGLMVQGEFINGEDIGSYTTGGGCGGEVEVHEGVQIQCVERADRCGELAECLGLLPGSVGSGAMNR